MTLPRFSELGPIDFHVAEGREFRGCFQTLAPMDTLGAINV